MCQLKRQSETTEHTVIASNLSKLPLDSKQVEVISRKDLAAILDRCSRRKSMFLPSQENSTKTSPLDGVYFITWYSDFLHELWDVHGIGQDRDFLH